MQALNDYEKSVLLAGLVSEWQLDKWKHHTAVDRASDGLPLFSLNERENFFTQDDKGNPLMPWARLVLIWAINNLSSVNPHAWKHYGVSEMCLDFVLTGARKPLDYILSVATDVEAIEAAGHAAS